MKKSFFPLLILSLFAASLWAQAGQFVQAPIIVQSGDVARVTFSLDSAINVIAVDDDLIYLPSGNFNIEANINRRVHVYGAGCRSDAPAVGTTQILAVTLNMGASGGSLNGVHVIGQLKNPSGQNLNSYSVNRCRFANLEFNNGATNSLILNMSSIVTSGIYFESGTLNLSNSIVTGTFSADFWSNQFANLNIENCFLAHLSTNRLFTYIAYMSLKNSIIFQSGSSEGNFWISIPNAVIEDNLFVGNPAGLPPNMGVFNAIQDIGFRSNVFEDYPLQPLGFNEDYDYHIQDNPPCGTPCAGKGIYAGPTPYKDVPENPYVTDRDVQIINNGQGLQLNFTVNKGGN